MTLMFLAEGFEEVEALCPLDMLRRAGVTVKTVSITKSREVCGAHGIYVMADTTVHELSDTPPEMVILPGGMPGAKNLSGSEPVKYMLTDAFGRGAFVAAICAAPFVLGELGILRGKEAVCFPGYEDKLEGAKISNKKVVRDGNVITAAGMGVSLKFGAELVKALCGKKEADRIMAAVLAD